MKHIITTKPFFRALCLSLLAALFLTACGGSNAGKSSENAGAPSLSATDEALSGEVPSSEAADETLSGGNPSSETADSSLNGGDSSGGGNPSSEAADAGTDTNTAPGVYADLQDWLSRSGDAVLIAATANHSLASTGITLDIAVDGSILIYRFSLPENSWAQGLTNEEFATAFNPTADSMSATVDNVFSTFSKQYGLSLNAVRFLCLAPDGAELYRRDFLP